MIRTPAQTRRRQGLGNAAAGRTTVVLYACVDGPRTSATAILAELRRFANAREWIVAGEILDSAPLSTPLDERPMWHSVREAIAKGRAEGIVAALDHTCDDVADTRAQLFDWLAEHAAFLATARCGVRSSRTAERSRV
ncbi:hypothetical protein [Streptomyces lydicus]|uniref:hypothetical protein n=1 Tax=Streptomyces lydicus TaxID=47763 RepID=UPI00101099D8|nr:hypothetical protein [Streptomyces lydicus]MCZ1009889.1 hypothetical protein [Streptomyces lydicus]